MAMLREGIMVAHVVHRNVQTAGSVAGVCGTLEHRKNHRFSNKSAVL